MSSSFNKWYNFENYLLSDNCYVGNIRMKYSIINSIFGWQTRYKALQLSAMKGLRQIIDQERSK